MKEPNMYGYTPLRWLSKGELDTVTRLLKQKLTAKTINVREMRLLLRAVATRCSAEDKAALRLRRTIHKTMQEKKQQTIQ